MISMERNIGSKKQSGEAPGAVPLRGTPVRALQNGGLPGRLLNAALPEWLVQRKETLSC